MKSCPICGTFFSSPSYSNSPDGNHRCPERTLRGIDAQGGVEDREPYEPRINERLNDGFEMMHDDVD